LARTRDQTELLHKFIFAEYIWQGRGQASIVRKIQEDPTLMQRFGGDVDPATVSYHVKQITEELENSIDFDAMDKFVGEFLRYQQTIDNEISDIDKVIELIDKEKKPDVWLAFKRFKKDLLDSRIKALADHELPLAVKKFKKERQLKRERILSLSEVKEEGEQKSAEE
jgi:hypothetical protein